MRGTGWLISGHVVICNIKVYLENHLIIWDIEGTDQEFSQGETWLAFSQSSLAGRFCVALL